VRPLSPRSAALPARAPRLVTDTTGPARQRTRASPAIPLTERTHLSSPSSPFPSPARQQNTTSPTGISPASPTARLPKIPARPLIGPRGTPVPSSSRPAAPQTLAAASPRSAGAELPAPPRLRCSVDPPSARTPAAIPPRRQERPRGLPARPQHLQRPGFPRSAATVSLLLTVFPRRRRLRSPLTPLASPQELHESNHRIHRPGGTLQRSTSTQTASSAAGLRRRLPCAASPSFSKLSEPCPHPPTPCCIVNTARRPFPIPERCSA
jgi:hypothetical protein